MLFKKGESYHAKIVINKTSKLNLIKVFVTLEIDVAICIFPDENSRAGRKH